MRLQKLPLSLHLAALLLCHEADALQGNAKRMMAARPSSLVWPSPLLSSQRVLTTLSPQTCWRQSPLWSTSSSSSSKLASSSSGADTTNDSNSNKGGLPNSPQRRRKRDALSSVLLKHKKTTTEAVHHLLQQLLVQSSTLQTLLKHKDKRKKWISSILVTALVVLGLVFGGPAKEMQSPPFDHPTSSAAPVEIPYSRFMDYCEASKASPSFQWSRQQVDHVQIDQGGSKISFVVQHSKHKGLKQRSYYTHVIEGTTADNLIQFLRTNNIPFQAAGRAASGLKSSSTASDVSTIVIAGGMAFYIYQNGGFSSLLSGIKGSSGSSSSGSSKKGGVGIGGMSNNSNSPQTSFDDIEGIGEAKEAVLELVDSLRNPEKYSLVGARAPTGLLLEGPPGTGKTTLARAAASLADVPFLSASGSEFVEKYVGQGAARVRELFERAEKISIKEHRPCIIFIDEIDALGKARSGSGGGASGGDGSSQESEHTLIQLLACMDGLDSTRTSNNKKMICVLGATNRKDVLDKALVRPGRFDRIVKVDLPDATGRVRILRVHAQKLLGFSEGSGVEQGRENSFGRGKNVDLSCVAAVTDGLSGAELEMIVNEAAIRAVRRVSKQLDEGIEKDMIDRTVYPHDFEASVDSFFQSRHQDKQRHKKQFGFVVEQSTVPAVARAPGLFYTTATHQQTP